MKILGVTVVHPNIYMIVKIGDESIDGSCGSALLDEHRRVVGFFCFKSKQFRRMLWGVSYGASDLWLRNLWWRTDILAPTYMHGWRALPWRPLFTCIIRGGDLVHIWLSKANERSETLTRHVQNTPGCWEPDLHGANVQGSG